METLGDVATDHVSTDKVINDEKKKKPPMVGVAELVSNFEHHS
jgi:hypothetical protein